MEIKIGDKLRLKNDAEMFNGVFEKDLIYEVISIDGIVISLKTRIGIGKCDMEFIDKFLEKIEIVDNYSNTIKIKGLVLYDSEDKAYISKYEECSDEFEDIMLNNLDDFIFYDLEEAKELAYDFGNENIEIQEIEISVNVKVLNTIKRKVSWE